MRLLYNKSKILIDFVVSGIITVKFLNFDLHSPLNTYPVARHIHLRHKMKCLWYLLGTYYIVYIPKYRTISVTHNNNDNNNNNNIYIDRHNNCLYLCR